MAIDLQCRIQACTIHMGEYIYMIEARSWLQSAFVYTFVGSAIKSYNTLVKWLIRWTSGSFCNTVYIQHIFVHMVVLFDAMRHFPLSRFFYTLSFSFSRFLIRKCFVIKLTIESFVVWHQGFKWHRLLLRVTQNMYGLNATRP